MRRPAVLLALLALLAPFDRALPVAAQAIAPSAAAVAAALVAPPAQAAAPRADGPGLILVLHSYQRDFSWTVGIEAGIEEIVTASSPRASLLVEHLDAKRLEGGGRDEAFADYLRSRYAGRPPDAIIASDNAALRFLVARRARLFPGAPVVFCGINDWSPALLEGQGGFTGVLERPDYAATIAAARSLFRGPRPVYLLSDHSSSGRATAKDCAGAILARFPDADLRDIPDLPLGRLEAWSAGLPRDALIFALSYVVDGDGRTYPPEEVVARLRAASGLPILTSHDVYFAPGALGGMIATAAGQGRAAAEMALAVLGGADPASMPVRAEGVNEYRFSHRELKRLGLSESALPEGAVLVGRPATLFEREPRAAGALIAATIFLLAALLGLAAVVAVQRRIRLAAAASERRFRGLFESMVFGSSLHELVFDGAGRPVDYRFLDVNGEYERLLGLDRSLVVGRTASEVYGSPMYLEEFAAVARGGARVHLDLPFKGRIYRTTVYSPDANEFATVFEDVTERRAASLALEESERRYRNLFDSMEEGVIYEDAGGETLSANVSALRILGLGMAELQGREALDPRWRMLSTDGSPIPFADRLGARCLRDGRSHAGVFAIEHPARRDKVWIAASAVPERRDGEDKPFRAFTTLTDITAIKIAEERLAAQARELAGKNQELERFTYTVSHDLKSPLITIKGFLSFLGRDFEEGDAERFAADLGRVDRAALRMQELLDDLLELSRIGRMANPPALFSMGRAAGAALENLAGRLAASGATVALPDDWPEAFADESRIVEVYQNLLENAVKYSLPAAPRIHLGWEAEGTSNRFFVRDEGIGIAPRYAETVFGLFNKLDPKSEGTGIGLALVRRIVELHGGRAWAESRGEGLGSTFWFSLPAFRGESP